MRQLLWLSLIPLTAFWLFTVDINGPSSAPLSAIACIMLGVAFSVGGFYGSSARMDKRYSAVLAPLILSCLIIPIPYSAGLIICASALAFLLIAPKISSIWVGGLFSGIVLILQSLALTIYYLFAPNHHEASSLSPVLAIISGLTGLDAISNQGMLFISSQKMIFPFNVTLEKLGFYPWILIFVGSLALIFLTSRDISASIKRTLGLLSVSFVYLLLRYLILVHIFFANDMPEFAIDRIEIFIDQWWLIASFIPLMLLFLCFWPVKGDLKFNFNSNVDWRMALALSAVSVSIFCLTTAAIYQDPGIKKDGRVLVDNIHSNWEPSTLKLDKYWYGEGSTYNAYSMIEWLKDSYHVDRIVSSSFRDMNVSMVAKVVPDVISDNLTYDILKNYDILIIETPSKYKSNEIDAIIRFVENGGGLFLIGDHTNFAGTGTNLNQISKRFGIEFGFDAINSINGSLYCYKRGYMAHPAVKYMPSLDFMTGCSLKAPLNGEAIILGFGMSGEPGEYSSSGFFRETRSNDPTQATDTTWGLINQAVALKYGRGRVVAFADSTITSNFRIFSGGSPNLIVGVMEYLDQKNYYENGKQVSFLTGLIFACLAIVMQGKRTWKDGKMAFLIVLLSLGALSASGALLTFSTKMDDSIPSQFYMRNHTVSFDGEHSDIITSQGYRLGQYETFFIWTQRVNLTPSLDDRLEDGLTKGRIVVVIDPIKSPSQEETESLMNYVKYGNSVLLMISSEGSWSSVLNRVGLETYQINELYNSTWKAENGLPIKPSGLAIRGGRALLKIDKRSVLAEVAYGKGKFVLFTDPQVFKDGLNGEPGFMGYYDTDPSTINKNGYDIRALYNLEYRIFEDYLSPKGNISSTVS